MIKILSQFTSLIGKNYLITILQPYLKKLFKEVEGINIDLKEGGGGGGGGGGGRGGREGGRGERGGEV